MIYRLVIDFRVDAKDELNKRKVMQALYRKYPGKALRTILFTKGKLYKWPMSSKVDSI